MWYLSLDMLFGVLTLLGSGYCIIKAIPKNDKLFYFLGVIMAAQGIKDIVGILMHHYR